MVGETRELVAGIYAALEKLIYCQFSAEDVEMLCKMANEFKRVTDSLQEKVRQKQRDSAR